MQRVSYFRCKVDEAHICQCSFCITNRNRVRLILYRTGLASLQASEKYKCPELFHCSKSWWWRMTYTTALWSLPFWKGDHPSKKLGMCQGLCSILHRGWEFGRNTPDDPCTGYVKEHHCSQGCPLAIFPSTGKIMAWKPTLEHYAQWQKAEIVLHRLNNEAQGLISLEPCIKFMGLRWGVLSKAFLIAQVQFKLSKVNKYYTCLWNSDPARKMEVSHVSFCLCVL